MRRSQRTSVGRGSGVFTPWPGCAPSTIGGAVMRIAGWPECMAWRGFLQAKANCAPRWLQRNFTNSAASTAELAGLWFEYSRSTERSSASSDITCDRNMTLSTVALRVSRSCAMAWSRRSISIPERTSSDPVVLSRVEMSGIVRILITVSDRRDDELRICAAFWRRL